MKLFGESNLRKSSERHLLEIVRSVFHRVTVKIQNHKGLGEVRLRQMNQSKLVSRPLSIYGGRRFDIPEASFESTELSNGGEMLNREMLI